MESPKLNALCVPCLRLLQVEPTQPSVVITKELKKVAYDTPDLPDIKHHCTFREFEQSAKEKCHLCLLFFNQIPLHQLELLRQSGISGQASIQYAGNQWLSTLDLQVWYYFQADANQPETGPIYMTLHLYPRKGSGPECG